VGLFDRLKKRSAGATVGLTLQSPGIICPTGYHHLLDAPEVAGAIWRISDMIASMTIHLMSNEKNGDVRVRDALAYKVDVAPWSMGTRHTLISWIVSVMLTDGNACVLPRTGGGLLEDLIPMPGARPRRRADGGDYEIAWRGVTFDPDEVLHFPYHVDLQYPWLGTGTRVQLQQVVDSLLQANSTKQAYMSSEYKPPIIISVNADSDLADPEKRKKFLDRYTKRSSPDEPWVIPAELMNVAQVRPLSLNDLAISDTVEMDKRTVASVIGVPAFLLGVGDFKRDEWNNFIQSKVRDIALIVQQEMTRALILSPKWYLMLNFWSLMDYDLQSVSSILLAGADRGYVCGDEWRDRMHMAPAGLKEYKVLENYIPYEDSGNQKKLVQNN
jgi:HK97 family phage portal protein